MEGKDQIDKNRNTRGHNGVAPSPNCRYRVIIVELGHNGEAKNFDFEQ